MKMPSSNKTFLHPINLFGKELEKYYSECETKNFVLLERNNANIYHDYILLEYSGILIIENHNFEKHGVSMIFKYVRRPLSKAFVSRKNKKAYTI